MSVSTLLGARSPSLVATGPLPTLTVLPGFLLYPDRIDALEPRVLDATFTEEASAVARPDRRPRGRGGGRRRHAPLPERRRGGHRPRAGAGPARGLGRARGSSRWACGCGAPCSCRRTRTAGHPRDLPRLRRGRDLPAARPRDRRPPGRGRQGRRRPALAGGSAAPAARRARGGRAQGDVQDGDLRRGELPRCTAVRGDRPRSHPLRGALAGTPSAIGGARLERFEREALDRLEAACRPRLDNPGT